MKNTRSNFESLGRAGLQYITAVVLIGATTLAMAGPREQARRIHDRLLGVPPSDAVLNSMAAKIQGGDAVGAATDAMNNSTFYNTTLKNFITPWTNAEQSPYADLNDYTATVIGMIRDDVPFNQVLTEDITYVAGSAAAITAPVSPTNNAHYKELETKRINLADPANLIRSSQSSQPGATLAQQNIAGVMTTRAFGEAFLKMGTNRRAVRFTFMTQMCRDMEDMHDVTRTPDRIRQDVSRSPGGDSTIFLNQCVGCHSGMDPLAQAFAYYDFKEVTAGAGEQIVMTPGVVQPKNLINSNNFPLGYIVKNDQWNNYWRHGPNASLGWNSASPGTGNGIKSLGQELSSSKAFSQCQVQKVFKFTCLRDPASAIDQSEVQRITDVFEKNNYNMKRVFAEVAAYCKGD
ncbi:MAG: DUF1585 domain-containing protein [Gammaproteobacteria bacterium]|nr:DUF1585 domain-containing protein [Gammaproteobacteria bacterium]